MPGNDPLPALTMAQWAARPPISTVVADSRQGQYPFGVAMHTMVASGVARQDVAAWARATGARGADIDRGLYLALIDFIDAWPDLPLRSALGWVLVTRYSDMPFLAMSEACAWEGTHPALVESGWLFMAAGVPAQEAADVLAGGGQVDEAALLSLAALRGAVVPVTGTAETAPSL